MGDFISLVWPLFCSERRSRPKPVEGTSPFGPHAPAYLTNYAPKTLRPSSLECSCQIQPARPVWRLNRRRFHPVQYPKSFDQAFLPQPLLCLSQETDQTHNPLCANWRESVLQRASRAFASDGRCFPAWTRTVLSNRSRDLKDASAGNHHPAILSNPWAARSRDKAR